MIDNSRDVLGGENRAAKGRRKRSYWSMYGRDRGRIDATVRSRSPTTTRRATTHLRPGAGELSINHLDPFWRGLDGGHHRRHKVGQRVGPALLGDLDRLRADDDPVGAGLERGDGVLRRRDAEPDQQRQVG